MSFDRKVVKVVLKRTKRGDFEFEGHNKDDLAIAGGGTPDAGLLTMFMEMADIPVPKDIEKEGKALKLGEKKTFTVVTLQ